MRGAERRLYARIERRESLLIRRTNDTPPEEATLARGLSVDVSAEGLCIDTALHVRPGDDVDVWVAWSPNGKKYLLAGEVRWCAPSAEGQQALGVVVNAAPSTDYLDWRQLFTDRLKLVGHEGDE